MANDDCALLSVGWVVSSPWASGLERVPKASEGWAGHGNAVPRCWAKRAYIANEASIADDMIEIPNNENPNYKLF